MKSHKSNYRPEYTGLKSQRSTYPDRSAQPEKQVPYFIDETRYDKLKYLHENTFTFFQRIASEYKELNLGPISSECLQKICSGDFSEVEKTIYSNIEKEVRKSGITNDILLDNLARGMDAPWLKYKESAQRNRDIIDSRLAADKSVNINVSDFTLTGDGELLFTDADKQRIREKCSCYVDNPSKEQFVKVAESVLKGLDELKAILARNNINSVFGYSQTLEILESATEQKIYFNKNIVSQIKI